MMEFLIYSSKLLHKLAEEIPTQSFSSCIVFRCFRSWFPVESTNIFEKWEEKAPKETQEATVLNTTLAV